MHEPATGPPALPFPALLPLISSHKYLLTLISLLSPPPLLLLSIVKDTLVHGPAYRLTTSIFSDYSNAAHLLFPFPCNCQNPSRPPPYIMLSPRARPAVSATCPSHASLPLPTPNSLRKIADTTAWTAPSSHNCVGPMTVRPILPMVLYNLVLKTGLRTGTPSTETSSASPLTHRALTGRVSLFLLISGHFSMWTPSRWTPNAPAQKN